MSNPFEHVSLWCLFFDLTKSHTKHPPIKSRGPIKKWTHKPPPSTLLMPPNPKMGLAQSKVVHGNSTWRWAGWHMGAFEAPHGKVCWACLNLRLHTSAPHQITVEYHFSICMCGIWVTRLRKNVGLMDLILTSHRLSTNYTLDSVVSHLWQPKCTWYYGVL